MEMNLWFICFVGIYRYYDLRLRYISSCNERAATEQDLGRAFRYVSDNDPELPTILASVKLHQDLQAKRGGRVGLLKHDPSRPDLMRCVRRGRGKECYPDIASDHPEGDTSPYRKHWSAGPKHFDHGKLASTTGASTSLSMWLHNPRRFALVAAPQIGKTGAFLHLVYLLWSKHAPAPGVPIPPAIPPQQPKDEEVDLMEPETEEDDEELLELDDEDELPEEVVPLRELSHEQVGRLVEHSLNERWGEAQQRVAQHLAGQRVANAGVDGTVLAEENQDLVDELKPLLVGQTRREVLVAAVADFRTQGGVPKRLVVAWAEAPMDEPLPSPS